MAEDPSATGEHILFGFKYTIPEYDNPTEVEITANGENSQMEYTFSNGSQSATLNLDKNQSGIDSDVYFGTQLAKFEYIEKDYIENNPATINNIIIAYVGSYYSDTVNGQKTLSDDDSENLT